MFDLWLRSGTVGIILIPFLVLYLIAAGIVWITYKSPARPYFASCVGIPGPFFASVAVLFGLFAAFLANDVQRRNAEAQAAVLREADGIRTILRLSEALGEAAAPLKAAAVSYAQSVLSEELPAMRQRGDIGDDLGVRNLGRAVLAPSLTSSAPPAVQNAMLGGLVAVRQARLERLTLAGDESPPLNWLATLMLGVLTQIAVAVVQLDKIRPQALALFVFTTAFATTVDSASDHFPEGQSMTHRCVQRWHRPPHNPSPGAAEKARNERPLVRSAPYPHDPERPFLTMNAVTSLPIFGCSPHQPAVLVHGGRPR